MTEVESLIDDLNVFIHKNRRHYLVRVSDGAIFPWKNAPEKQRGVKGNFMGAGDICGVVEPYGEESIVYINANRQIVLLNVAGGELQERVISPSDGEYTKAMFVAPTTEGYLGTVPEICILIMTAWHTYWMVILTRLQAVTLVAFMRILCLREYGYATFTKTGQQLLM
jgi:hypothetical protein